MARCLLRRRPLAITIIITSPLRPRPRPPPPPPPEPGTTGTSYPLASSAANTATTRIITGIIHTTAPTIGA